MSPAYTARFDRAVALALEAFRHSTRKGGEVPYVTHLFAVTALVGEHGGDEDQLIAAMLHDYLEDIEGASYAAIEADFGERVARMVAALSDTDVRPKPPWHARKVGYLQHLGAMDPAIKLISAADKFHNTRATRLDVVRGGLFAFDRFNADILAAFNSKAAGTLWYHRAVCEALGEGWEHPMLDLLRDEVRGLFVAAGEVAPW